MSKKILNDLYESGGGFLTTYKRLRVGEAGWLTLIGFELVTLLFTNLPGALGLFLRSRCYRPFFGHIGRDVFFGVGVVIRNPARIRLGDRVVVDDYALLDAKGDGPDRGITLGDRVFVSRNVTLGCKCGKLVIGSGVTLGPHTIIHALDQSEVTIGDNVSIAANVYIVGAPDYRTARNGVPMAQQGFEPGKGIHIGSDVWLGASTIVLDGATIRDGAIVGAMALVRGEIPPYAVALGIPATVRKYREEMAEGRSEKQE